MRKADRLFQVVNIIRVHQPITAAKLAERLGVSVRTVYRYIEDLSIGGIPIYGEAGIGYSMHNDFELAPLTLNRDELDALVLSVEILSRSVGYELQSAAKSLLSKIEATLPSKIITPESVSCRALHNLFDPKQMIHWDHLHQAVRDQHAVYISYMSLTDKFSNREIWPLGLFYWGGKWTVGAWCTLKKAYRDFRIDRIQELSLSKQAARPKEEFNFSSYMQCQADAWSQQFSSPTDSTLSVGEDYAKHFQQLNGVI